MAIFLLFVYKYLKFGHMSSDWMAEQVAPRFTNQNNAGSNPAPISHFLSVW